MYSISPPRGDTSVFQSVKVLLAFASTVIPGLILLEIHGQGFYSLLDMSAFRNGSPLRRRRGRSFYVDAKLVAP
jgi:hypothetical protein